MGILNLLGWIFGIQLFTSIVLGAVTMKPVTALMFCFSSFVMACLDVKEKLKVKTEAFLLLICAWMLSFCYLSLTGNAIFSVKDPSAYGTYPGIPSIMTSLGFMMVAWLGIVKSVCDKLSKPKFFGYSLLSIGLVAILGYIVGIPWLFYYKVGVSAGMAIHTAFSFCLIGWFLLLLDKR